MPVRTARRYAEPVRAGGGGGRWTPTLGPVESETPDQTIPGCGSETLDLEARGRRVATPSRELFRA